MAEAHLRMKKPPIGHWLEGNPCLDRLEKERIMEDNERMSRENLARLRVSTDRNYGQFSSIAEATATIPRKRQRTQKFIVRCVHRTTRKILRQLFVPWDAVARFVQDLPGGQRNYLIGIREVSTPTYSGTIISSNGGKDVVVEMWSGKHLDMDSGTLFGIMSATFHDDPRFPRRFVYSDNCWLDDRKMMMRVVSQLGYHGRIKRSLFAEFNFTEENGLIFIGASFDPFWTGDMNVPPKPAHATWGD